MSRRQAPVEVAPPRPERFSMTLLSLGDKCMRAAYLSLVHDGGAPSHDMARGSLFHSFAERAMWTLIEQGEPNLYGGVEAQLAAEFEAATNRAPNVPELDTIMAAARSQVADHTAEIVDEVLRETPGLVVPRADVDDVREMAYHWAVGYDVGPERVLEVERKFLLRVGGHTVSCKLDVIATDEQSDVLCVDDYKTSFHMPPAEEVARDFQLWLYAAAVAFGVPVEKVPCEVCATFEPQEPGEPVKCDACGGRGSTERELEPVGDRVNYFRLRQVYPRYLGDDGLVRTSKPFVVSRTDLHDFLADLERDVTSKFASAFETGQWDAVPGSHCETFCPAKALCPLPGFLRDHAGTIETREQAAEALAKVEAEKAQHNAITREVRNWAKRGGPVPVGRDLVWEWRDDEKRETDYDALDAAVNAAVEFGEPFAMEAYRKTRVSTSFRKRKLTKAEVADREREQAA